MSSIPQSTTRQAFRNSSSAMPIKIWIFERTLLAATLQAGTEFAGLQTATSHYMTRKQPSCNLSAVVCTTHLHITLRQCLSPSLSLSLSFFLSSRFPLPCQNYNLSEQKPPAVEAGESDEVYHLLCHGVTLPSPASFGVKTRKRCNSNVCWVGQQNTIPSWLVRRPALAIYGMALSPFQSAYGATP